MSVVREVVDSARAVDLRAVSPLFPSFARSFRRDELFTRELSSPPRSHNGQEDCLGPRRAGAEHDPAGPPLPARRGHPVCRCDRRLLQAVEAGGRDKKPLRDLLRRAFHGGERGYSGRERPNGDLARPERRLLDGRHGRDWAGGRLLGIARAGGPGSRSDHAHHVHELDGGHQGLLRRARRVGLHFVECASGLRLGIRAASKNPIPTGPASGAQHSLCHGHSARRDGDVGSL